MKVAVLGSTGLVGKNVLKLLARLPQVVRVFCPVRNVPDLNDLGILEGASKLDFKQVDFEQDDDAMRLFFYAGFVGCDAVVCCLGTTRKQAGSKAAQEKIDLRLPLKLSAIAKKAGVKNFLCVSAMGADSHSPYFYNRLKGQLEEGLDMIGFETLTLVRPSLLLGKHKDRRFGEELLQKTIGAHPEWIPAYVRPVHAETVAAHLVTSALKRCTGDACASGFGNAMRII